MRTVMVLNAKGGAGKTTIATTIASYYATQGLVTVLKDHDPQGSSTDWLKQRPLTRPTIHGISAFRQNLQATRAWQLRLPQNTERLVIDSPAGVDLPKLATVIRNVDKIIIPVIPSPIDIRASAMFIRELFQFMKMYPTRAKVAVVASRVPEKSPTYIALQRVFTNLEIPLVARIGESEHYINGAEHGIGLFEMDAIDTAEQRDAWISLINWLEDAEPSQQGKSRRLFAVESAQKATAL